MPLILDKVVNGGIGACGAKTDLSAARLERFHTRLGFLKDFSPGVDFSYLVGPSPWVEVYVPQGLRNSFKVNEEFP